MEVLATAQHLARIVLFSEAEDPKEFLRKRSQELADKKRRKGGKHFYAPAEEWPEWEDLEDWKKLAIKQLEDAENTYFALKKDEYTYIELESGDGDWWTIFQNEDAAIAQATGYIRDMLQQEPETFNQDWLQHYINTERLQRDLYQDLRDDDYWSENYPDYESKIDELLQRDKLSDDPRDETDGEITPEIESMVDDAWEEMIDEYGKRDAIEWLEDIYGDEARKKAIEIAGIDIDAAVDSAIGTDGWQHYLARYDGHSYDLPGGAIYIRQ